MGQSSSTAVEEGGVTERFHAPASTTLAAPQGPSRSETPPSRSTSTLTLGACAVVTLVLAAKTVHSRQRARQASCDARAWRRVSMALLQRHSHYQHPAQPTLTQELRAATALQPDVGAAKRCTGSETSANDVLAAKNPSSTPPRSPSASWSTVHPHEDWNWVPADHPRPRRGWKASWLTPAPVVAPPTLAHSEAEDVDGDLWLMRSALWPECDPVRARDASSIPEDVTGKAHDEGQETAGVEAQSAPKESKREPERVEMLERQVWALLSRAEDLERRLGDRQKRG